MTDVTTTALFIEAARLAREDSKRYWANNDKRHLIQKPDFWGEPIVDTHATDRSIDAFRRRNRLKIVRDDGS